MSLFHFLEKTKKLEKWGVKGKRLNPTVNPFKKQEFQKEKARVNELAKEISKKTGKSVEEITKFIKEEEEKKKRLPKKLPGMAKRL